MAQWVKNPPAMQEIQETWVRSLGWEDSLDEEVATHSSIFAWKIPRTEEPGGQQSMGLQRIQLDLVTKQQQQQEKNHNYMISILKVENNNIWLKALAQ